MCSIEDAEPWDCYFESSPRARTPHRCCECGTTIKPGETYHRAAGAIWKYWYTYKTCMACVEGGREWLLVQCSGWIYGNVYEELVEHWAEGYRGQPISHRTGEKIDGPQLGAEIAKMRNRMRAAA